MQQLTWMEGRIKPGVVLFLQGKNPAEVLDYKIDSPISGGLLDRECMYVVHFKLKVETKCHKQCWDPVLSNLIWEAMMWIFITGWLTFSWNEEGLRLHS